MAASAHVKARFVMYEFVEHESNIRSIRLARKSLTICFINIIIIMLKGTCVRIFILKTLKLNIN